METTISFIEYLEEMDRVNAERGVLEFILKTFEGKKFTAKQLVVEYMAMTHKHIDEETVKAHMRFVVDQCPDGSIYSMNDRGHYKFLF